MFDPLHKWLGIPPSEQPPNHYRLLGLALFESDPEVIDAAADKQLSFLHDLTNGEHAGAAEQLSNQVSAARLCLLNEDKKRVYDETLQSKKEQSPPPIPESYDLVPANETGQSPPPIASVRNESPRGRNSRARTKLRRSYWIYSLIPCAIALCLVAIGIWSGRFVLDFNRLKPLGIDVVSENTQPPKVEVTPQNTTPRSTDKVMIEPDVEPEQSTSASEPAPEPSPSDPKPTVPKGSGNLGDLMHQQGQSVEADKSKHPLPSTEELKEKRALISELYKSEYTKAKSPAQKVELGKLMHREGQSTTDDPVGRFELWRISREILTREGEFALALGIVDNFDDHYQSIDVTELKSESLIDSAKQVGRSQVKDYLESVGELISRCLQEERFGLANQMISQAYEHLRSKMKVSERTELERFESRVQLVELVHTEYKTGLEKLTETEDDPQANQQVGRYLCLIREQWDQGLKHLASGTEPKLRAAAVTEISSRDDADSALAIADGWMDAATIASQEFEQENLRVRALAWYLRAEGETKGLEQKKVEVRIDELKKMLPDEAIARASGEVVEPSGSAVVGYRLKTSADSKSDFANRRGNTFNIGMGTRRDGRGEAMGGIELQGVKSVKVTGSASEDSIQKVDNLSKAGFVIDYHTPGGYVRRVFLGLGMEPGREFTESPPWGTETKPETVTDIGKSFTYDIDLTRWAPPTWDERCWFTIYMQNAGPNRWFNATVSW